VITHTNDTSLFTNCHNATFITDVNILVLLLLGQICSEMTRPVSYKASQHRHNTLTCHLQMCTYLHLWDY